MSDSLPKPLFAPPPALVLPGTELILRDVFVFRCPLCANEFRYDDPYEPLCTGPHPTLDEHGPEVMRFARREPRRQVAFLNWKA